jgi:GNAT superfamily N-acetyltransferase
MAPTWSLRRAVPGADDDAVSRLMVEYLDWALGRLRKEYSIEDPPTEPGQVRARLGSYQRPQGLTLLGERAGRPVGVAALRAHEGGLAEVKRMYVAPAARGEGLGAALLDRLIAEARALEASLLRLDTCRFMAEAQRLYRSRGFAERGPYPQSEIPPRLQRHWLFFELELGSRAARPAQPDLRLR